MEFFPAFPAPVYLQALLYVLVIAFIVEHLGLVEACISGNSSTVGRKPDKGNYSLLFLGKRLSTFIMQGTFCTADFPFLANACLEKGSSLEAVSTGRKWDFAVWQFCFLEHGTYGAKMAYENECSWNRRRVWWNHFSGSLYLPSFYRMAEFL